MDSHLSVELKTVLTEKQILFCKDWISCFLKGVKKAVLKKFLSIPRKTCVAVSF